MRQLEYSEVTMAMHENMYYTIQTYKVNLVQGLLPTVFIIRMANTLSYYTFNEMNKLKNEIKNE